MCDYGLGEGLIEAGLNNQVSPSKPNNDLWLDTDLDVGGLVVINFKKLILGITIFPFVLCIVLIVTPLMIIGEILEFYNEKFNSIFK
jgi:hypothetical protein